MSVFGLIYSFVFFFFCMLMLMGALCLCWDLSWGAYTLSYHHPMFIHHLKLHLRKKHSSSSLACTTNTTSILGYHRVDARLMYTCMKFNNLQFYLHYLQIVTFDYLNINESDFKATQSCCSLICNL